jgi:apolipoprotein N-acyltransferase
VPRGVAALLAVVGGLALALTLPRPGICLLGWIGLAPLIYATSSRTLRESFKLGWLAGFAFHGLAFYWIYSTCRFAGIVVPVAVLAWAALCAFQAVAWGASATLGRWLTRKTAPAWRPLVWAVAWTAGAVLWERWTPRLPGDLLQYTQWRHLALLQIASIGGPHALGFIVALVNAGLAQAWDESEGGRKAETNGAWALCLGIAFAAAALVFGEWALVQRGANPAATAIHLEILQPNVDQYQKWDDRYGEAIMGNLGELLARPRETAPALVVWPESALPWLVREGEGLGEAGEWSRRLGSAQLVGAVTRRGGDYHNSLVLLDANGAPVSAYHKRELVVFGEYVPFASFFRAWIGKLNELGGITRGADEQPLFDTPLGRTAGSICYEAVFPRWARRDAHRGARVIVNVTNDGWYKQTWGPYQHYQTNVYRAIENRATVIRAGNTGISAAIDPWGVVLARQDLNTRGRLDADVPSSAAYPEGSFYSRHGDWLGLLCLAVVCALGSWALAQGRRGAR